MARYNFLGVARDQFGNLQPNIDVSIYLTGTTTAATVYATRTGSAITTAPQITTDANGRFNFYLDSADYPFKENQRFDVVAAGLTYSDIEIARGIPSVSASSVEQDQKVIEYVDTVSAPSGSVLARSTEYTDTQILSVSAASIEQDQRVREYAASLESPSGNIINRATEYTDVQITSVSAASDEKDQRIYDKIETKVATQSLGVTGNVVVNENIAVGSLGVSGRSHFTGPLHLDGQNIFAANQYIYLDADRDTYIKGSIEDEITFHTESSQFVLSDTGIITYSTVLYARNNNNWIIGGRNVNDSTWMDLLKVNTLDQIELGYNLTTGTNNLAVSGTTRFANDVYINNQNMNTVSAASVEADNRIKTPDIRKVDNNWWVTSNDDNTILLMDNPTSSNVYLGDNVDVGTTVVVLQRGTGTVTAATSGADVTILSADDLVDTRARYSTFTATCVSASLWMVSGDLA